MTTYTLEQQRAEELAAATPASVSQQINYLEEVANAALPADIRCELRMGLDDLRLLIDRVYPSGEDTR